jgi:hypothetical protein
MRHWQPVRTTIADGIDYLPHVPLTWASHVLARKEVLDQLPFGILEVGRVGLGEFGHSPILPDHLRNTLLGLQSNLTPDIGAISSQKALIIAAILFNLSLTNTF